MSNEENNNVENNVNSGLQLDPEVAEGLKMVAQKAKEEKAQKELQERRTQTLTNLKGQVGDEVYNQLQENGLKELIENKPDLLDSPAGLAQAIENVKLKMQLSQNKPPEKQEQENADPGSPGASADGDGDRKIPKAGSKEFYEALGNGEITADDINKMEDLRPEDKLLLINNLPEPQSKGRKMFFGNG